VARAATASGALPPSVLQRVAVCCSQCVAIGRDTVNILLYVPCIYAVAHWQVQQLLLPPSVLQQVAVCCSKLQCVADSALQLVLVTVCILLHRPCIYTAVRGRVQQLLLARFRLVRCSLVCCSVSQPSVLQFCVLLYVS